MKLVAMLPILLACAPLLAVGEDSFFFHKVGAMENRVEGETFHLTFPIKKIDPPKASAIYVSRQDMGYGRKYRIQIDLVGPLPDDWMPPMMKLGEDVIDGGIYGGGGERPDVHVQSDDLEKIKKWTKLLAKLLKIPEEEIEVDMRSAEERKKAEKEAEDAPAK